MFWTRDIHEQYSMLCTEILEPTMKKIALSFSVSTSDFYDTVHDLSFSPLRIMSDKAVIEGISLSFDEIQGYDRALESLKSKQRLYRIAKRLTLDPETERKLNHNILLEPKVYEERIYDVMARTYATVADMVGDQFFNTLDVDMITRSLQIETRDDRLKDRICFSFSEFAMYVSLYMALNRASVEALHNRNKTDSVKKRMKGRIQLIRQWLYSDELRDALVRTFLNIMAAFNEEKYKLLLDKHLRDYWLPDEKSDLKYLQYAADQNYFLKFPKINFNGTNILENLDAIIRGGGDLARGHDLYNAANKDDDDGSVIKKETEIRVHDLIVENTQVQVYQAFFHGIIPTVSMLLMRIVPKDILESDTDAKKVDLLPYLLNSNKIDRLSLTQIKRQEAQNYIVSAVEYQLARMVCSVIDTYIDAVIDSVSCFLECLPESDLVGKEKFHEWLARH